MAKLDIFKQAAVQMGYSEEELTDFLGSIESAPEEVANIVPSEITVGTPNFEGFTDEPPQFTASQTSVTTPFGARSSADVFSGGINYGVDLGVGYGTTITIPEGQWQVVESFGGANPNGGYRGNYTNRGYGNSVLLKDMKTGEMLRYSHLSQVGVKPGQVLKGGQPIAKSGNSGNSTGAHLDLEYLDAQGRLNDPMKSRYAPQL